jgi:hypothetical protein
MKKLILCAFVAGLTGCASVQYGDKAAEADLKKFAVVPGKTSLYVCRVRGFVAGGITSKVLVDGKNIGFLKPETFVHTVVEPGEHAVQLANDGIGGSSGIHSIQTKPDEIAFVWAGVTGGGWGVYTVDNFSNRQDGYNCVTNSAYSVVGTGK